MEEEKEEKTVREQLMCETEKVISDIVSSGIQESNIDMLSKVVDIHKDISNEDYWEEKMEDMKMRYRNYSDGYSYGRDSYGRGRSRDSRGRYREGSRSSGYGAGEDMIAEMYEQYGGYYDGKQQGRRGDYGAKEDSMKSLEYMLQSVCEFMEVLKDDADSQEEMDLISRYAKKISEM